MNTIVSATPTLNVTGLSALFLQSIENNTSSPNFQEVSIDQISLITNQLDESNNILILHSRAEYYIAEGLRRGSNIDNSANEWLRLSEKIIDLQKKHRKIISLLNVDLWQENHRRWPAHLTEIGFKPIIQSDKEKVVDFFMLAACQYVQQKEQLQKLNTLLIACSQPITEDDSTMQFDFDKVIHENFMMQLNYRMLEDNETLLKLQLKKNESETLKNEVKFKDIEITKQTLQSETKNLTEENERLASIVKKQNEKLNMPKEAKNKDEVIKNNKDIEKLILDNENLLNKLQFVQHQLEVEFFKNHSLLANRM